MSTVFASSCFMYEVVPIAHTPGMACYISRQVMRRRDFGKMPNGPKAGILRFGTVMDRHLRGGPAKIFVKNAVLIPVQISAILPYISGTICEVSFYSV